MADLDEIEQTFAARGADVQVELSHLGDPQIAAVLTDRGYRLASFENVLGLALDGDIEPVAPPGVEVRRSGEAEFDGWLDVVADGFAHPDTQGVPSHEDFPRDVLERAERDFAAAGVVRYLAVRDTIPAGGASLRIADGWLSSQAPRPRPRTAVGASKAPFSPPGSSTRRPPAATSRSSPPNPHPSLNRTYNAAALTCSTPAPSS